MSLVTQFLTSIRGFVLDHNGDELRNWLLVENDAADVYYEMGKQLRSSFPANSPALEKLIEKSLPEEEDVPEGKGSPWPGFNSFIKEYLEYWRDVDFDDVVRLHSRLSDLLMYEWLNNPSPPPPPTNTHTHTHIYIPALMLLLG